MIQYKGGNGSSKQESKIILGTANEVEGIDAEYSWPRQSIAKKMGNGNWLISIY